MQPFLSINVLHTDKRRKDKDDHHLICTRDMNRSQNLEMAAARKSVTEAALCCF